MEIFLVGFLAGLALAIPLGPMAILLITTTIQKGRRTGFFGALAMASVDFGYALVVFALGSLVVSSLSDWLLSLRVAGSVLLLIVAIRVALNARKPLAERTAVSQGKTKTAVLTYITFFGLTVINPATAFYFVGITPSVSALSANTSSGLLLFGLGVFIGSVIWQMSLVFASHLMTKIMTRTLQTRMQYLGAVLIALLAILLLLQQ